MDKSNLITSYIERKSLNAAQKRTSSALSPGDSEQHPKKANITMADQDEGKTTGNTTNPSHGNSELKSLLGPLIDEVKLFERSSRYEIPQTGKCHNDAENRNQENISK